MDISVGIWRARRLAPNVHKRKSDLGVRLTGKGELRVLVVDSDPLVRLGTVMMLRDAGYKPRSAHDVIAVKTIISEGFFPQLMVVNHDFTSADANEIINRVRSFHSNVGVLLMSEYGVSTRPIAGPCALLAKPFTLEELAFAVETLRTEIAL
jgi:DNA-binding NtrC family response regulator